MDATAAGGGDATETVATAEIPSTVAEIRAVPGATAATTPFASTVATPGLLVDHVMGRLVPVDVVVLAAATLSCAVPPGLRLS